MKACMIAYTMYEMDNRVRRYAELLVNEGWSVDAIALSQEGKPAFEKIKGVNVYRIQKRYFNEKGKFSYLFRLLKFLFLSAWFVTKKHLRQGYSLIHVHSIPDFEVFSTVIPKLTGAKIILDIHDIVPELFTSKFNTSSKSFLFKMLLLCEKVSFWFADYVIVANHIWYNRLITRSIKEGKCSVVMNYPDPNIFKKKNIPKSESGFIMTYPGTLSRHQGITTVIDALNIIKDKIANFEFHIYGQGTDEEYLKEYVKERDLGSIVKFQGVVSIEKVSEIMEGADLGVEPKLGDGFSNEAFSTKILEFMLVDVPVIASDTAVHKYYIDETLVHYFKSGDPQKLAEAILLLYNNKELRQSYVEKSRKFIAENNWDVKKEIYLNLVNNLVPEKAGETT